MADPVAEIIAKILLGLVTNSAAQASRWAYVILEQMREADLLVEELSTMEQLRKDLGATD
jgi:hypothetical protein